MKFEKKDGQNFSFGPVVAVAYAGMETLPADVSLVTITGRRGRSKSTRSDRFFFILEGSGAFSVADKRYDVAKEDVIFVPKETMFYYEGDMKLVEFGLPPYEAAAEIDLES